MGILPDEKKSDKKPTIMAAHISGKWAVAAAVVLVVGGYVTGRITQTSPRAGSVTNSSQGAGSNNSGTTKYISFSGSTESGNDNKAPNTGNDYSGQGSGSNYSGQGSGIFNITTPHYTIAPNGHKIVSVNTLTETAIPIRRGDRVSIAASGLINVGPVVGDVSPDGLRGIQGSLFNGMGYNVKYNIVPNLAQGALLYRIGSSDPWHYCGSGTEFTASERGQLEFQINDSHQEDNAKDDYFRVDVSVL